VLGRYDYSIYNLGKLKLKPSDLEGLSEEEKIQKIRSQLTYLWPFITLAFLPILYMR